MAKYQALANLSIGWVNPDDKKERKASIVKRGDFVELDDETARGFKEGHRVPMIRDASEADKPGKAVTAGGAIGDLPQLGSQQSGEEGTVVFDGETDPEIPDPKRKAKV